MNSITFSADNEHPVYSIAIWLKSGGVGTYDGWVKHNLVLEEQAARGDGYSIERQHPVFDYAEWQGETANGNTQLGYSEWVEHRLESAHDDMVNTLMPKLTVSDYCKLPEVQSLAENITRLNQLDKDRLLTDVEAKVAFHLREAWSAWVQLEHLHPDAVNEFRHALHMCQYLVGMRQVARVDRDTWVQR